jgi:riboflavin kinase/FMN adenylyltransferase
MRKSVVAIGNFDGVHLGHQHLLAQAEKYARKLQYDFVVLTFSPHPRIVFQPNIAPFRITPDVVKTDLMNSIVRPDRYEILPFDDNLQMKSAQDFINNILINQFNAGIVIVGENFHFGHKRSGTIETLQNEQQFTTIPADLLHIGDKPVTSTRIRDHLKNAEIGQANSLLGWEWYIQSEVVHGDKRGRELGYPTANMHFGDTIVPSHGVYAVKILIEGETQWRHGAANIGIRPMFETAMPMVETFIFNFDDDLYGKQLKIEPVQKLRDEMKFDSLEALKEQMKTDCILAKNILKG